MATFYGGSEVNLDRHTDRANGQAAGVGITYHPNGMVKEIAHGNGVVVTQANDPNGMARPSAITAALGTNTLWTTRTYKYDGAGNIWKMGTSWYEYDFLSRLKTGTVFPTPLGSGTQQQQAYSFDDYGNLQSTTTQIGTGTPVLRSTPASATTNRLTGAVAYDSAGSLTSWNSALYTYDAFDQMSRMTTGTEDWVYVYDADDERLWSYNLTLNVSRWTIRDLSGKVLRDFANNNGTWSVAEDYLYRNGLLFAGYLGNGQRRHFALDHLGTVRLITNSAGTQTGYHIYYPFGEEATPYDINADRMQFTGHERDLNSQTGTNPAADDLDHMHARFFNPWPSRFLAVDAVGGNPRAPQSWNRYAYVMDNPLTYSDPTGMDAIYAAGGATFTFTYSFANDTSVDWSSINNFFSTSYNFFSGGANAFSSNFLFGYGRYNRDVPGYQLGQAVGDLASIPYGLEEALLGGGTEVGGFVLDLTGIGAIIGVPANVLGGAMIVQGSTASGLGYVHFMEGMKGGGKTGRKINQDRAEVARGKIEELKAAKANAKTNAERKSIQKQLDHWRLKLAESEEHARIRQGTR